MKDSVRQEMIDEIITGLCYEFPESLDYLLRRGFPGFEQLPDEYLEMYHGTICVREADWCELLSCIEHMITGGKSPALHQIELEMDASPRHCRRIGFQIVDGDYEVEDEDPVCPVASMS